MTLQVNPAADQAQEPGEAAGAQESATDAWNAHMVAIDPFGAGIAVGRAYASDLYARRMGCVGLGALLLGILLGATIGVLAAVLLLRHYGG